MPLARRSHDDVVNAAHRLQTDIPDNVNGSTSFFYQFGHSHEPNAYESVLEAYPSVQIYEQPLHLMWSLPPELQSINISQLPLIGASPDGVLDTDPAMPDSINSSVLELKAKVPYSCIREQWRFIENSSPKEKVEAAHFAQVQLEMLVTKEQAYLVYWSCTTTHIFRICVGYEWLTVALELLCDANM